MSNRIQETFARCKEEGRPALVIYLCCGDPSKAAAVQMIEAAINGGADIIELGMPFSDPTADGPIIQKASERALKGGMTMDGTLACLKDVRSRHPDVPMILFGYYNPILKLGEAAFAERVADAGGDGALVVDLPPEECLGLHQALTDKGLSFVPLIAPTTTDDRLAHIGELASSFVYLVSLAGVTGTADVKTDLVRERISKLREHIGVPIAVGFGIKTPEDVTELSQVADGIVVGSAVVSKIADADGPESAASAVESFVGTLSAAAHGA